MMTRPQSTRLARLSLLTLAAAAPGFVLVLTPPAPAGTGTQVPGTIAQGVLATTIDDPFKSWMGVINADRVRLYAGQYESFYHMQLLNTGDVVRVVGTAKDFLRVELIGPAFKDAFGYVKVTSRDEHLVRVAGSGLVTLGEVNLYAPNMAPDAGPQDGWKRIHVIPADTRLAVRDTVKSDDATYYAVELPRGATAWVAQRFVGQATEDQVRKWEAATGVAVARNEPAPSATPPKDPPVLAREESSLPANVNSPSAGSPAGPGPGQGQAAPDTAAGTTDDALATEPAGTSLDSVDDAAPATEKPAAVVTDEQRLAQLEAMYEQLKKEPIESAEVLPLRDLYETLGSEASHGGVQRYAGKRAAQLEIWAQLQKNRLEVAELQKRLDVGVDETQQARIFADTTGDYTAVGRLAASTIYDGQRLPLLYRLQEPTTRRTIAYLQVQPDGTSRNGVDLTSMLGQFVGVIGDRVWDERMKVNRIDPRRMDLLAAQ